MIRRLVVLSVLAALAGCAVEPGPDYGFDVGPGYYGPGDGVYTDWGAGYGVGPYAAFDHRYHHGHGPTLSTVWREPGASRRHLAGSMAMASTGVASMALGSTVLGFMAAGSTALESAMSANTARVFTIAKAWRAGWRAQGCATA